MINPFISRFYTLAEWRIPVPLKCGQKVKKIYYLRLMEQFISEQDVVVFCVTAKKYPEGIIEAFQLLESLHPSICERPFYGISQHKYGKTIYKAAVKELYEGEGKKYGCETFTIPKGEYLTETIVDFMDNIEVIPNSFKKLLSHPRLDKKFPCLEWYKSSKKVMCMVRLLSLK